MLDRCYIKETRHLISQASDLVTAILHYRGQQGRLVSVTPVRQWRLLGSLHAIPAAPAVAATLFLADREFVSQKSDRFFDNIRIRAYTEIKGFLSF